MSAVDERLTTSPMLFGYRGRDGRLAACDIASGRRFRLASQRAAEIVTAFVEPRSAGDAVEDGFTRAELDEAQAAGILVPAAEDGDAGSLWERSGWSRPAYLLFSQTDIPYEESEWASAGSRALTGRRRAIVEEYGTAGGYPVPGLIAAGARTELPEPPPAEPTLRTLTARRSVRRFSDAPPDAGQLAGVLHAATAALRTLDADRAGGDPFRLLNSFYSWAHLFVVVQEVEELPCGVFEYDWRRHELVHASEPPCDEELASCVQGQRWVLGPGFAVFVVGELRGYAWLYRHSRAYIHVLTQLGELGQELLMAAGALGLGGWTTPAVHESRSAKLLGLPEDDALEALSVVKLGRPLRPRVAPATGD